MGSTLIADESDQGREGRVDDAGVFGDAGDAGGECAGPVSVDATPWSTYVVALELGTLKRGEAFVRGRH